MNKQLKDTIFRVDTHCDSILTVEKLGKDLSKRCIDRQLDFPGLYENGINLQFFALFVETKYKPHFSIQRNLELLDLLHEQMDKYENVTLVENKQDLINLPGTGQVGVVISIEDGDAIESLGILRSFYRLGVRSICLTWNNRNQLADGVGEFSANGGLTKFGVEVVKEMNRLGMLIDVSHICEKSFWDVISITDQPIIASHSNAYSLCKHPRNLKDEQIKEIARNGGVVSVTFETDFLGDNKDINSVVNHIKYISNLVGTEHVGIGSDFDGLYHYPMGLEDISKWRNIEDLLQVEGFSDTEISNIMGKNIQRLLLEVLN